VTIISAAEVRRVDPNVKFVVFAGLCDFLQQLVLFRPLAPSSLPALEDHRPTPKGDPEGELLGEVAGWRRARKAIRIPAILAARPVAIAAQWDWRFGTAQKLRAYSPTRPPA
jgi:hypothetical protein